MSIVRFDISSLTEYLAGGNLILVPNHRTMDMILETWAQSQSEYAWPRPRIYAIDVWIQESWMKSAFQRASLATGDSKADGRMEWSEEQPRILSSKEELLLWRRVLDESDIAPGLINKTDTAKDLNRAHQLVRQWQLDEAAFEAYKGIPDVAAFRLWQQSFVARCKKLAVISLSDATALFVTEIERQTQKLSTLPIVLCNFDSPPPLYRALFAAIASNCGARSTSSSLSGQPGSIRSEAEQEHQALIYGNEEAELRAAADWAAEMQRRQPCAHIGIVCPAASGLAKQFDRHLRLALGIGESPSATQNVYNLLAAGEPLIDAPLVALALDFLSLNLERIDSRALLGVLASPLLRYEGWDSEVDAKMELLRQLNRLLEPICSLASVRSLMLAEDRPYHCPKLAALLLQIDETRRLELRGQHVQGSERQGSDRNRMSSQRWSELFRRQCELLQWPLNRHLNFDDRKLNRLLKEWDSSLANFCDASSLLPQLSAAAALAQFKMILRESNQPNTFDAQLNVSLMSAEQALMYRFDYLRVIQLTAKNWPGSSAATPFIPFALQQEHGMPAASAAESLAECKAQLAGMVPCTAQAIIYSSFLRDNDGNPLRPSALIDFSSAQEIALNEVSMSSQVDAIEFVSSPMTIPLADGDQIRGGSNLINNQSQCPFRAFARHRLDAARIEPIESGLSPADRGSALHLSLKKIWERLGDSTALRDQHGDFAVADELIEEAVNLALNFLKSRYPLTLSPRYAELEHRRMKLLLLAALELDFSRPAFEVIEREQRYEWHSQNLLLRLQIDRIDKLGDGSLAVIDYKTGKRTQYQWLDERPDDLQLPLYQLVVSASRSEDVSATLICQINPESFAYLGISGTELLTASAPRSGALRRINILAEQWPQITSDWRTTIDALADEFERGHAPVEPASRALSCRYCDLSGLCRIAELDSADQVSDGNEPSSDATLGDAP